MPLWPSRIRPCNSLPKYTNSGLISKSTFDDGFAIQYAYDALGRLSQVGDYWRATSRNPDGAIVSEEFGNSVAVSYSRDLLSRPTRVTATHGPTTLFDLTAAFTPFSALASISDRDGTGVDHSAVYQYDGGGRIIQATVSGMQFDYAYDALQNIVERTVSGKTTLDVPRGAYTYGGGAMGPRQLSQIGDVHFTYDAAGRMISDGNATMTYNASDGLVALAAGASRLIYSYGFDGKKTRVLGSAEDERDFLTDYREKNTDREHTIRVGPRSAARAITSSPRPASGRIASTAPYAVIWMLVAGAALLAIRTFTQFGRRRRVAWAPALAAILSMQCAHDNRSTSTATVTALSYQHATFGPSPTMVTDEGANVLDDRVYEPYGTPIHADLSVNDIGANNAVVDTVTQLADHGARWSTSKWARWLSPDAASLAPTSGLLLSPWDLNPYLFVRGNPLMYDDPDGNTPTAADLGDSLKADADAGDRLATQAMQRDPTNQDIGMAFLGDAILRQLVL